MNTLVLQKKYLNLFLQPCWLQASLLIFLASCQIADNQENLSPASSAVVNPKAKKRDFLANNEKHKVIMAVIDTGVDYNHPLLASSIHFKLDAKQEPTQAGFDFIGNDPWPAPYLARTNDVNKELESYEQEKSLREKKDSLKTLKAMPELSFWLNPLRSSSTENSATIIHGTHVAGLMVYDQSELGLIPYRILPFTLKTKIKNDQRDFNAEFIESLALAIADAAKNNVKVINLSLGAESVKPLLKDGKDPKQKEALQKYLAQKAQLTNILASYPQILFVAAAGNSGLWTDGKSHLNFPCGIELPNILCVGALDDEGDLANFTNVPINKVDLVFAPGEQILSTIPTQFCSELSNKIGEEDKKTLQSLFDTCLKTSGQALLDGTSMATPIVSRLAGMILLKNPDFSPVQVIQEIYAQMNADFVGRIPVYKYLIEKPSWAKPLFSKSSDLKDYLKGLPGFQDKSLWNSKWNKAEHSESSTWSMVIPR